MRRATVTALVVLGAVLHGCADDGESTDLETDLEADLTAGRALYAANCAACHGPDAQGTGQGPGFLNEVYVPSHHADEAFQVAVARGVQPHHWDFGPMPPVEGLSRDEVADIVAHVRSLQAEAGLLEE